MLRRPKKTAETSIKELASKICEIRTRLNLSQLQFAQKVGGISQQTVSDWEKGKRLRQVQTAMRLVRLFNERNVS